MSESKSNKKTYVVRDLVVGDILKIVNMLKKLKGSPLQDIMVGVDSLENTNGIEKESKESMGQMVKIGMLIVDQLVIFVEGEFFEWVATLVDCTSEEFKKAPVDVLENIVETFMDSGKNNGFFLRVFNIYKKMKK